MIIVTGATGQLGHAIVESLARQTDPAGIGASARDPQKAEALQKRGVRVRSGDYAKPETLAHAFEGATQVLLISSNGRAFGADPLVQHRDAIAAAKAAGAKRIVYTAQIATGPNSQVSFGRDHAATEQLLRESGLAWTSLRNGFYISSGLAMVAEGAKVGLIEAPEDGEVSWTAHADLADAAAAVLLKPGQFEGPTPPLTGSEALDFVDLARVIGEVEHRTIRRTVISEEQLREKIVARGLPPLMAEFSLSYFRASKAGEFAPVDSTLERLIGRKPTTVRQFLESRTR